MSHNVQVAPNLMHDFQSDNACKPNPISDIFI